MTGPCAHEVGPAGQLTHSAGGVFHRTSTAQPEGMMELEYCFLCGEPTERAGRSDDSIYCNCGAGPFCLDCWHKHECDDKDDDDQQDANG